MKAAIDTPIRFPCEAVQVFPHGSPERDALEAFAAKLNEGFLEPRFTVEDCVFSHDPGKTWTTILGRTGWKLTVQILSPVEQFRVLTGKGGDEVAKKLRAQILERTN